MMRKTLLMLLMLLSLACTSAAQAQTTVTLRDLVQAADHHPSLRAENARAESVAGDVTEARTWSNPTLGYSVYGLVAGEQTNGGSTHQVDVNLAVPMPHAMGSRAQAAEGRLDAARAEMATKKAEFRLEAARRAVHAIAAQARVDEMTRWSDELERFRHIVQTRQSNGGASRFDVTRLDLEARNVAADTFDARSDLQALYESLNEVLGTDAAVSRVDESLASLDVRGALEGTQWARAIRESAAGALRAAQQSLRAAENNVFDHIEVGLGALTTTWPSGTYLYGHLGVPLPVLDRNAGPRRRAQGELDAQEADSAWVERRLAVLERTARDRLRAREQASEWVRQTNETSAADSRAMAESGYVGGQLSIYELLDVLRAVHETKLNAIEALERLHAAEVEWFGGWGS